jgi:hypothetical protein
MTTKTFLHIAAIYLTVAAVLAMTPASLLAASITNPSFEADGNVYLELSDASGWSDNLGDSLSQFNGEIGNTDWHTDGSYGAVLLSQTNGFYNKGDKAFLKQSVDLTDISTIQFDAQLSVSSDIWKSFLNANFYVDSDNKWSSQTLGTYLNQSINVSGLTGVHTLEFRLEANAAGDGGGLSSSWYEFDNVRLIPTSVPEPSTIATLFTVAFSTLAFAWSRRKRTM